MFLVYPFRSGRSKFRTDFLLLVRWDFVARRSRERGAPFRPAVPRTQPRAAAAASQQVCLEFAEFSPRPRFPASPHSHVQCSELDVEQREAEKTGILSVFVFLHGPCCSCLPSFPESNQNAFLRVTWTDSVFSGHLSPLNEYVPEKRHLSCRRVCGSSPGSPAQTQRGPGGALAAAATVPSPSPV